MTSETWTIRLERDILGPLRRAAVVHPFIVAVRDGTLPRSYLKRYVSDTLWAVRDFALIASSLAERAPLSHRDGFAEIAREEIGHPDLLARAVDALGGSSPAILDGDSRYFPTPIYALWWQWVLSASFSLPWLEAIAVVMVGIESLARVQEAIVADALVRNYDLTTEQAAWYLLHGGEDEEEHGNLGLRILGDIVRAEDTTQQRRLEDLIVRTASPLLFQYPDALLSSSEPSDTPQSSPATQALDGLGIRYRLIKHPAGTRSAMEFAAATQIPSDRVFKTLLLSANSHGFIVCCVQSARKIAFAPLSSLSGATGLSMAVREDIPGVTGFECNTVSPFGLKAGLRLFVDEALFDGPLVYLGSGISGYDMEVGTADLLMSLRPTVGSFAA